MKLRFVKKKETSPKPVSLDESYLECNLSLSTTHS